MKMLFAQASIILLSTIQLWATAGELQIHVTGCDETMAINITITKVSGTDVYDSNFNRTNGYDVVEISGVGPVLYECDFLTGEQTGNGQLGYGLYSIEVTGKNSRNVRVCGVRPIRFI